MAHRVQHTFQHKNGLPKDQYVNTWYFNKIGATPADCDALATVVRGFYSAANTTAGFTIMSKLSGMLNQPGAKVKVFNMDDVQPRPVISQTDYTPVGFATSGGNLPSELACCLSYAAAPVAGVSAARLRGRVYIGPLNQAVLNSGSMTSEAVITAAFQLALPEAAQRMKTAAAAIGWTWVQWSTVGNTWHPVVRVWVDDAFDIQRRRGIKALGRTSVPIG